MVATLRTELGTHPGQIYSLDKDAVILGRHPQCDIVLEYLAVSRQHARLYRTPENGYFIEDLGSRNGTAVNGEIIHEPRELRDKDEIKICDVMLSFHKPRDVSQAIGGKGGDVALLVDDEPESHLMSSIDISSHSGTFTAKINPETKLRAIIEITQNLGKALSLDEVLTSILNTLFKIFPQADRGFVVLRQLPSGTMIPKAVKYRHEKIEETPRLSRTIAEHVMNSKEAILSIDAAQDSRFNMSQSITNYRIRSIMCAPLVNSEQAVIGVLQIDTQDQRSRFIPEDLELLASIATQCAIAVENAQLHEAAVKQKSMERELQLAHKVQMRFLPHEPPRVEGYQFFDYYEPANQVGGDFFDYLHLPGNKLAVVLADVSGKGIAAALLVAKLSADVRNCLLNVSDPAKSISRLNEDFLRGGWEDRFVTMLLMVLDYTSHELTVVNAGHMAPFLKKSDGCVEIIGEEGGGYPLGIEPGATYSTVSLKLQPGELVLLYTDGVSDAMNGRQNFYSVEKIQKYLNNAPSQEVNKTGEGLIKDVKLFTGNQAQSDDLCVVVFGRTV